MNAPQITMIVLITIGVVKSISHYGEYKKADKYDIFDVLINPAISVALLYWGGFWE